MAKNNEIGQLVAIGLVMAIGYAVYTGKLGNLSGILGGFKLPTAASLGGAIASPTSPAGLLGTGPGATNSRPAAAGPSAGAPLQGTPSTGGWAFSQLFGGQVQSPLPYQLGTSVVTVKGPPDAYGDSLSYSATLTGIDGPNSAAQWTLAPLVWDPTYGGGFGAYNPDAASAVKVAIPWDTSPDASVQGLPAAIYWKQALGAVKS